MHTVSRPCAAAVLALACAACTDVSATNPYDEKTPTAQQAKALVSGTLVLPAGFSAARFSEASVGLVQQAGTARQESSVDAEGRFLFEAVPGGLWSLHVAAPPLLAAPRTLVVPIGEPLELGEIELEPPAAGATEGGVTGRVRLEGAGALEHGDVLVRAAGTPWAAVSRPDGVFDLPLPAGRHALSFGHAGYQPPPPLMVRVPPSEVVTLEEEVVLVAEPGLVRGTVVLPEHWDAELLGGVEVRLRRRADDEVVGTEGPASDGLFVFPAVAPGGYFVQVLAEGLAPETRAAEVLPGSIEELGRIELRPPTELTYITGTTRLDCGLDDCDHGGTRVQALGRPFVTLTAADGTYRLAVVAGRYTLQFVHAGYEPEEAVGVRVAQGETEHVDDVYVLTFLPGGLTGRVSAVQPTGGEGPAAGAIATLRSAGGGVESTPLAEDGSFGFSGLRAGPYVLSVSQARYTSLERDVRVVAGETIRVAGRLELPRASLGGRVTAEAGVGRPTVLIRGADALLRGFHRAQLTEPPAQAFSFRDLPLGRYEVLAIAPEAVPAEWREVELVEGGVELGPLDIEARTHALDGPRAVAGAELSLRVRHKHDLQVGRRWLEGEAEPEGWVDLGGPEQDSLRVELPEEGPHVVLVRLANDAARDADVANDLFAYRSQTLRWVAVRDDTPPTIDPPGVAAFATARELDVALACRDTWSPAGLRVAVEVDGIEAAPQALRATTRITLGDADGAHQIAARCIDVVGHEARSEPVSLVLDRVPPTVSRFELGGGAAQVATPSLDLHLEIDEATSGLAGVAISEAGDLDCAAADYGPAPQAWVFSGEDGPRQLFVCARDHAGNLGQRVQSNLVVIDTLAPPAGALSLAEGRTHTNARVVPLALQGAEDGATVDLFGAIAEAGRYALADLPPAITLLGGDGSKTVEAVLIDAAGNESRPFRAEILLDTVVPAPGEVLVAEGRAIVHTRNVGVTVSGTDADRVRLWEVQADADCQGTCSDPGYVDFASSLGFTLGEALGPKRLCVQLCDLAGNSPGAVARDLELDQFVPRPRPTLAAEQPISPLSHEAFSREGQGYPLTIRGRGIAHDTVARVGDEIYRCASEGGGACRADAEGGCAEEGLCADTCAELCVVDLPDAVMRRPGTYVVRLETPAPVFGGLGASEASAFFSVVAPLPEILGWRVLDEDFPERVARGVGVTYDEAGLPESQEVVIEVRARNAMDNATIRLGDVVGAPHSHVRDPQDPRLSTVLATLEVSVLAPLSDRSYPLAVANPTPGGGSSREVAFGVHAPATECEAERCVGTLGLTRPHLPDERGVAHAFRLTAPMRMAPHLVGTGASAVSLRDREGRLLARVEWPDRSGRVPLPLADIHTVVAEDRPARNGRVVLRTGNGVPRAEPRWAPAELYHEVDSRRMRRPRITDLDGDGWPDVLLAPSGGNEAVIGWQGPEGREALQSVSVGANILWARASDADGDGSLDLYAGTDEGLVVARGLGDRRFAPFALVSDDTPVLKAHLVDTDRDGTADLIGTGTRNQKYVWVHGDARGGSDRSREENMSARWTDDSTAWGDLTGDGLVDAVIRASNSDGGPLVLHPIGPDGALGAVQHPQPPEVMINAPWTSMVADVDADGAQDVVHVTAFFSVFTWRGLGDGRTEPPLGRPTVAANLRAADLADLDGDGTLELLVGLENHLGWSPEVGGQATLIESPCAETVDGVTVSDLDLDGAPDLFIACGARIYLRRGLPEQRPGGGRTRAIAERMEMIELGDLDGDGATDVVGLGSAAGVGGKRPYTEWWLNLGDGELGPRRSETLNLGYWSGAGPLVDLDADGHLDHVYIPRRDGDSGPDNDAVFRRGRGDGTFEAPRFLASTRFGHNSEFQVHDLDGDGCLDIAASGQRHPLEVVAVRACFQPGAPNCNPDGDWTCTEREFPFARLAKGVGDLDGDGLLDLIWPHEGLQLLLQNAEPPRTFRTQVLELDPTPEVVRPADFDNDGHLDLALAWRGQEGAAGRMQIAWGDGQAGFALDPEFHPLPAFNRPRVHGFDTADVNGDGYADIVFARATDLSSFTLFVNDHRGGFFPVVVSAPSQVYDVDVGHYGADGAPDIAMLSASLLIWDRPAPIRWRQALRDMPAPEVPVALPEEGEPLLKIHQAMQYVETAMVRVRMVGAAVDEIRLSLESPNGERLDLPPALGRDPSAFTADLSAAMGARWQGQGYWKLHVTAVGESAARITDFEVRTLGWFHRELPR